MTVDRSETKNDRSNQGQDSKSPSYAEGIFDELVAKPFTGISGLFAAILGPIIRSIIFLVYLAVWCAIGIVLWAFFLVRATLAFSLAVLVASFKGQPVDDNRIRGGVQFLDKGSNSI